MINRKSFNEKRIISIKWQRKMLFRYRFIQRNSCELQENCTFKGGVRGDKRTGRGEEETRQILAEVSVNGKPI